MKQYLKFLMLLILSLALIAGINSCSKESSGGIEPTPVNPTPNNNKPTPEPDVTKDDLHQVYVSGMDLVNPQDGQPKFDEAFAIFKKNAKNGDDSSMFATAFLYEYGLGTKADLDSALFYYKKAADKGSEVAKNKMNKLLANSQQNTIVFPKGSKYKYNDVIITSDDGLHVVNGNATFEGTGSSVKAMLGDGLPLYFSFNNIGHKSKVILDAKETAASLLIAALPYVLSEKVDDQVFDNFKNEVKALPLTEQFAKQIDKCIIERGFLDAVALADDFQVALEAFYGLFDGDGLSKSKSVLNSYNNIKKSLFKSDNDHDGQSGQGGGGGGATAWDGPCLMLGTYEQEGDELIDQLVGFKLTEYEHDVKKDVWKCKFKITNASSFYLAINKIELPKTEENVLDGIETYDMLSNVIGPFMPPDVFAFKEYEKMISATFVGFWDLITKHELDDYYSPTKDFSMEFKSEYDAIAVTSFSKKYPELLVYYIIKDIALPLVSKIVTSASKSEDGDDNNAELTCKFVSKLVLNDKIIKKVWTLCHYLDTGDYDSDDVAEAFGDLCQEIFDSVTDLLIDYFADEMFSGIYEYNAWGEPVLTAKGAEYKRAISLGLGQGWANLFGKVTNVKDIGSDAVSGIVWVKAYKIARKAYKYLMPLTGFTFRPFTVSLSSKSFAMPALALKLELTANSVFVDEDLYLTGFISNKFDNVHFDYMIDGDETGRVEKTDKFTIKLPTDELGEHIVIVKCYKGDEYIGSKTASYFVGQFHPLTLDCEPVESVTNGIGAMLIASTNKQCNISLYVNNKKVIGVTSGDYLDYNLSELAPNIYTIKVVATSDNEIKQIEFDCTVIRPDTPATGNTSVPSVPGSEINSGIPNSSYAPNVNGQNVNSEYNSGGNTPSVKGQNLDQYYNGGGSTPDIKGTNL